MVAIQLATALLQASTGLAGMSPGNLHRNGAHVKRMGLLRDILPHVSDVAARELKGTLMTRLAKKQPLRPWG
jgi:hypothetical protein